MVAQFVLTINNGTYLGWSYNPFEFDLINLEKGKKDDAADATGSGATNLLDVDRLTLTLVMIDQILILRI